MFQFPRFPPVAIAAGVAGITATGLPHSEIPGSPRCQHAPRGFSQRGHVLHRPQTPRHPPCAHLRGLICRSPRRVPRTRPGRSLVCARCIRTAPASPRPIAVDRPHCACHRSTRASRHVGGAAGIRTPDLRRARAALSQLSYGPLIGTRFPPPMPRWARLDSNQGPRPYQGRALTT